MGLNILGTGVTRGSEQELEMVVPVFYRDTLVPLECVYNPMVARRCRQRVGVVGDGKPLSPHCLTPSVALL
ncbi:hypothetical protein EVAR_38987_1 [Eumeta japonica]|uniref:Uncharacterized protein n=1 Tax=Eumeta variegata TaxID=151549 RepID=A0A4C1WB60_EUMVA|nr:hypothetical protein EVAR_38987_1 [Eumeta japonica]